MGQKLKLVYFDLHGRAEVARLALDIGDIAYEDVRLSYEQWQAFKPKTPYGQLPVLEVDGKMLAQSFAISRYCAKRAGLLPSDRFQAALCDEVFKAAEDVQQVLAPTVHGMPDGEKPAARQKLLNGPLGERLAALDKRLSELAPRDHFVGGDKPSHGDLAVLYLAAWLTSGVLDGIPTNVLQPYSHIEALKERVAYLPVVRKRYENRHDPMSRAMQPTADFFSSGNHPPRHAERKAGVLGF